ncbi:MAG TPA: ribonuclease HII [Gammaproteobacteria bacterium]|nr:ribonuclease HII [Gammaproteobacteria bacterium]
MKELIAGVDEAGVGPLAGPVVAAAVILNPKQNIYKLRDSKILSAIQRDNLYFKIQNKALAVGLGIASVEEIDQLNIFHATMLAMERAIKSLSLKPSMVLIDGRSCPKSAYPMKAIVQGDRLVKTISAASIIAKVTRDRIMEDLHVKFPHYNFAKHKGYSTKEHQRFLTQHGPCEIHRRSFLRVQQAFDKIKISSSDN